MNILDKRIKARIKYEPNQVLGPYEIIFLEEIIDNYDPNGRARRNGTFKCHCGKIFNKRISSIKSGHTKGCGCDHVKHGLSDTEEYSLWKRIKRRCFRKTCNKYPDYGGRGITLYKPWVNDPVTFIYYISSLPGYREKNLTLDRINNDSNYEPGNLRWATAKEQANNKRNNIKKC